MGMVKIKAPVTVFYNDAYVAPGTEIEIDAEEAASMTKRYGEWEEGGTLSIQDLESINILNEVHAIHSGSGDAS